MAYNNVKLLSEHNRSRIFVDGTEIKSVTRLDVHRDADSCKTVISIDFECDLDTVERKKDRFFVDEREYERLQKLAKPLQEWLLKHYNIMCYIRVDGETAVVVSNEMSVPFGDK